MSDDQQPEKSGPNLAFWRLCTSLGAKLGGGAAGVGATIKTGNPFAGAAVNSIVATSLEKVGHSLCDRLLAPRQEIRVRRAVTVAGAEMNRRLQAGEIPRDDGFFEQDESGQSPASETLEATLLAAMNSAQERKVDFIANMMASFAFDSDVDVATAHFMIQTTANISFRAFAILKIADQVATFGFALRNENMPGPPSSLYPLMAEVYDMIRRGLLEVKDKADDVDGYAVLGVDEIEPARLHLSPLGSRLFDALELRRLQEDDTTYRRTLDELEALSRCGKADARIDAGTA